MNPLVVTIIIYTGYFLLGCVALAWGVVLPELATELHMSDVISGSFFTIFPSAWWPAPSLEESTSSASPLCACLLFWPGWSVVS